MHNHALQFRTECPVKWTATQERSLSREYPLPYPINVTETVVTHVYLQFLWLPQVCVVCGLYVAILSAPAIANSVSELRCIVVVGIHGCHVLRIYASHSRVFSILTRFTDCLVAVHHANKAPGPVTSPCGKIQHGQRAQHAFTQTTLKLYPPIGNIPSVIALDSACFIS